MPRALTEDDIQWITERVVEAMTRRDLDRKSVGMGNPESFSAAGKLNAVYSQVDLTGLDLNNVDVPHALGAVPTFCSLVEWENAADPTTVFHMARPVSRHLWTKSTCRVALLKAAGTQAGTVARFLVGGR